MMMNHKVIAWEACLSSAISFSVSYKETIKLLCRRVKEIMPRDRVGAVRRVKGNSPSAEG